MVSFSDGLPDKGKGIPYFYLTALDPTATNALKDQRSSFTISEYSLGTCGKADPENPTCAKITLVGKVGPLIYLILLRPINTFTFVFICIIQFSSAVIS